MPHRRKPRRSAIDRQLFRMEQPVTDMVARVLPFRQQAELLPEAGENLVGRISTLDVQDITDQIERRYDSAEEDTNRQVKEIERSERAWRSQFPDLEDGAERNADDFRIYMPKTMEHIQQVYAHLDGLTGQLNPLVTAQPKPAGLLPPRDAMGRAKLKEILINQVLDDNRFKDDVLPRWRWNYLKHPSAFMRVMYETNPTGPDLKVDVVDRGSLFIDPFIRTSNVRDAAWVIEQDWWTVDEIAEAVNSGKWYLDGGAEAAYHLHTPPPDPIVTRLLGRHATPANARGPERDELIEVWHYWQSERRGQPHAYGVMVGGRGGTLVRWGPNPFAYKGIPYRGKAYMRDSYRVDGISLARQYRNIQELYNTFLNLRIADVLENVKRRVFVLAEMFDEQTSKDHRTDQKYIRMKSAFIQQMIEHGMKMSDFLIPDQGGDSTQHLLQDLGYLNAEGAATTSISDIFRGQNPQTGATLGQVQEQLQRSLGVFRPIYTQEMRLIEEVGEIICTYLEDPEFFGEERLVSIIGPSKYTRYIPFETDKTGTLYTHYASADEMEMNISVDVVNQAEKLASRTLRLQSRQLFFESMRHQPDLMKEAGEEINFTAMMLGALSDMGEDVEAITRTPQEKQERAKQQQVKMQGAMQQQMQIAAMEAKAKGLEKQMAEEARAASGAAIEKAKGAERRQDVSAQHEASLEEITAKIGGELRAAMTLENQEFQHDLAKMLQEFRLEMFAMASGTQVSIGSAGPNKINKVPGASGDNPKG